MVSVAQRTGKDAKRVALYLRSASAEQNDPAASLASQRAVLLDLVGRHDLQVVGEYEDAGISSHLLERPGLDQLLQDAQAIPHWFDIVLVADLSRISRDAVAVMEFTAMLDTNAMVLITADQLAVS